MRLKQVLGRAPITGMKLNKQRMQIQARTNKIFRRKFNGIRGQGHPDQVEAITNRLPLEDKKEYKNLWK